MGGSSNSSTSKVTTTTTTKNETITTIINEEYDKTGDFLLGVEDVFTISGKGTAALGKIEKKINDIKDDIQIIGLNHETITTTVVGILEKKSN